MRVGLNLPAKRADGTAVSVRDLMDRSRRLEELGVDGIWIGDNVARGRNIGIDTFSWLMAAAAGTDSIELGTAVLQVPLRYPVEFAQRLMSVFALSGGRFTIGLGSGSIATDFEAVGVDHSQRFRMFNEAVPAIRKLLDGENVGTANLNPWPDMVGKPQIIIGAWHSGPWIKRAARKYDGWMASGGNTSFGALKEGAQIFRDLGGKRMMVGTVGLGLGGESPPLTDEGNFGLRCSDDEAVERLSVLAELGFEDVTSGRLNYSNEDWPESDISRIVSVFRRVPVTNRGGGASEAIDASAWRAGKVKDPVCKRYIDPATATAVEFNGTIYQLCNVCLPTFQKDPARYVGAR